jgi:hypothetical protein
MLCRSGFGRLRDFGFDLRFNIDNVHLLMSRGFANESLSDEDKESLCGFVQILQLLTLYFYFSSCLLIRYSPPVKARHALVLFLRVRTKH